MKHTQECIPHIAKQAPSFGRFFALCLSLFALLMTLSTYGQAAPKVAVMPSYTQLSIYANAEVGQPITVWGRVFEGQAPYTYTLDLGDGSPVASGNVTDPDEISVVHTYTTAGLKTFTLTVTDSNNETTARSGVIRAIIDPTHEQKVNMAVSKAKLFLYRSHRKLNVAGNDLVHWRGNSDTTRNEYMVGATASAILAFEQNGHLPSNDAEQDVYQDIVEKGLEWLTYYGVETAISNQTHGDPDTNGNGKGVIFYTGGHQTYANAFVGLALVAAEKEIAGAQARTVQAGSLAGRTYYSLVTDLMNQFAYCQSDQATWGGWQYNMNTASSTTGYDGSSTQWIAFFLESARDLWEINPPAWVVERMCIGYFTQRQNANGGIGYSSSASWINTAKTGGALGAYKLGGYTLGTDTAATNVARAVDFIGDYYTSPYQSGGSNAQGGVFGEWYCMYSVKRGMVLQEIDRLQTVIGERDWQTDIDLWLMGDAAQLPATINPGERTINHMFGQQADGSWSNSAEWPSSSFNTRHDMNTAMGILMLTRSLPRPRPVAIIAPVGIQSNKPLARAFQMTGSDSYHLDPNASIIEYLWDFDDSDGLDWNNPGATGVNVTNPGYDTIGTYVVTLRVKDNGDPAFFDTYTIEVEVTDQDVPPVAVPIPTGVYSGRVNQAITLDGSSSYDADGDEITLYSWDLDGNGTYGDATGVNPQVTYASEYVGQVGLQVTAAGVTSTNSAYADIIVSGTDLTVQSFVATNITPNVQADLQVTIKSDDASANDYTDVQLKFYDGDPLNGGIQVGLPYTFDITAGGTAVVTLPAFDVNGADALTVWIDSNQGVPEWDESNNFATTSVSIIVELAAALTVVEDVLVAGAGTSGLFELTISNAGPDPANNIVVDTDLTLPTGVTFVDAVPSAAGTTYNAVDHEWTIPSLAVDASISLLVRFDAAANAPGVFEGIVCSYGGLTLDEPLLSAAVNDPQTVKASVVNAGETSVVVVGPLAYNPQTNLGEGYIDFTNNNPAGLPAVRVYITNLPAGVQVMNASGTGLWNGVANTPYFLINGDTAAGETQRIKVQYYHTGRDYAFVPTYQTELLPSALAGPAMATVAEIAIEKLVMGNNDVRVAFPSVAGKTYVVSYSPDLVNWIQVRQTITGVASISQFIDYGLPVTESPPSEAPQRFYKVHEVAAP